MRRAKTLKGWSGERIAIPDVPEEPRARSKKDTKQWCHGKVGLEHDAVWISRDESEEYTNTPQLRQQAKELRERNAELIAAGKKRLWKPYQYLTCRRCGKKLKLREEPQ